MASLPAVPRAIRSTGLKTLAVNLGRRVAADDLSVHAAAVAYAWLFAVFPFLIFLLTLFAYLPESKKVNARNYIKDSIQQVMAKEAAETLLSNLDEVLDRPRSGLLVIGLATTLWIASGGMRATMTSLDAAYDAKRRRPFYVQWPLAVLLTFVVAAGMITVFLLVPVGTWIEGKLAEYQYFSKAMLWALTISRYGIACLLAFSLLSLLYHYGTVVKQPFTFFSPGAVFTVVVWFLLGWGFRFYVDRFGSYQKTYGAVGGVTILLLFFYLDAFVLLFGAEINSQLDECCATEQRGLFES